MELIFISLTPRDRPVEPTYLPISMLVAKPFVNWAQNRHNLGKVIRGDPALADVMSLCPWGLKATLESVANRRQPRWRRRVGWSACQTFDLIDRFKMRF